MANGKEERSEIVIIKFTQKRYTKKQRKSKGWELKDTRQGREKKKLADAK